MPPTTIDTGRRRVPQLLAAACVLPWQAVLADAGTPPASTLPVSAFAQLPLLAGARLSPDGRRFSALINIEDNTALVVQDLPEGKPRTLLKTDNERFRLSWAAWASNDRLLVSMHFASRREFTDTEETRLISVGLDGSPPVQLSDPYARQDPGAPNNSAQIQDRVIDWLPDDDGHVLLSIGSRQPWPSVYRLDVRTGERRLVQAARRGVRSWMTDAQHRVRIGIHVQDDRLSILGRAPDSEEWRTLWSAANGIDLVEPMGFGTDPQQLWVRDWHEGHQAVFTVDLSDPALPRTLRLARPGEDIEGDLLRSPRNGDVIGVGTDSDAGTEGEPLQSNLFDPRRQQLMQAFDRLLPERSNRAASFSRDENRCMLFSSGNGRPGRYFVFLGDGDSPRLMPIANCYPKLPERMAGKAFQRITARDGLPLDALLTRPMGAPTDRPLPLVLLPHGGPQGQDDADFDIWTEFLASRGYAVLQINFRGSTGSGKAHTQAGNQRWGLEMQDDLTDGTRWAVQQGVADPGRIAIVGASYGGYAALMGAIKTPELYRCAVSFAGVTDLIDLAAYQNDYVGGGSAFERQVGRVWGDRARLRETSPALHADRIRVPVLLAHGSDDRVVPVDQSRDMARALRRADKPHRYIEQAGGDHHLGRYSHRLEFFTALESFLAEHLRPVKAG